MEKRYVVTVPNAEFSERVAGVQFSKGKAMIDEHTVDESLGRSVEEIVRLMQEFGYSVREVKDKDK